MCDASSRLGANGVNEIKAQTFFAGIDWQNLSEKKAPYIPSVKGDTDTRNFDKFEENEPWFSEYKWINEE